MKKGIRKIFYSLNKIPLHFNQCFSLAGEIFIVDYRILTTIIVPPAGGLPVPAS